MRPVILIFLGIIRFCVGRNLRSFRSYPKFIKISISQSGHHIPFHAASYRIVKTDKIKNIAPKNYCNYNYK